MIFFKKFPVIGIKNVSSYTFWPLYKDYTWHFLDAKWSELLVFTKEPKFIWKALTILPDLVCVCIIYTNFCYYLSSSHYALNDYSIVIHLLILCICKYHSFTCTTLLSVCNTSNLFIKNNFFPRLPTHFLQALFYQYQWKCFWKLCWQVVLLFIAISIVNIFVNVHVNT